MSGLEVRFVGRTHCRGGAWAVFEGAKKIGGVFNEQWEAEHRRDAILKRRARQPRTCLRCGRGFESEGPHHRMCGDCRRDPGDGADEPYAVAGRT
jgi:hypothetical protein